MDFCNHTKCQIIRAQVSSVIETNAHKTRNKNSWKWIKRPRNLLRCLFTRTPIHEKLCAFLKRAVQNTLTRPYFKRRAHWFEQVNRRYTGRLEFYEVAYVVKVMKLREQPETMPIRFGMAPLAFEQISMLIGHSQFCFINSGLCFIASHIWCQTAVY